jgi:hypothetical protein
MLKTFSVLAKQYCEELEVCPVWTFLQAAEITAMFATGETGMYT